jgi:hypothetical protein
MYDALQATKELAHDCRTYGTAFRLGVSLIPFSFDFCLKLSFGNSICLGFQKNDSGNFTKKFNHSLEIPLFRLGLTFLYNSVHGKLLLWVFYLRFTTHLVW